MNEQTRHFEARMIRYQDEQILTMVRDITERKNAEQSLRENQTLLKTIMDNCPAIVFLKDRGGTLSIRQLAFQDARAFIAGRHRRKDRF